MPRKRKPTALAILHGNPTQHRLPDNEPVPPGELKTPPDWLTAEQKEGWAYVLANSPPGLLRRLDKGALAIWVVAEDTHRKAAGLLIEYGGNTMLMRVPGTNQFIPSPYLSMMNKQAMIMLKVASEMGFTPASRARVFATPSESIQANMEGNGQLIGGGGVVSLAEYLRRAPPRPTAG